MKTYFIAGCLAILLVIISSITTKAQNTEEVIQQMIDEVSIENLSNHIQILEDAGGTKSRITFTPGVDSAALYVKRVFDSYSGLNSVELDTFYISSADAPYNEQPQMNVVATIEGDSNPEQVFVIGAHLDATANNDASWNRGANWNSIEAPGADDNASGLAAIMEIARIMTDPSLSFSTDFTIKLVAFGAEESGAGRDIHYSGNHHGSMHFAEQSNAANENILAMISVDMIGFNQSYDYASFVKQNNFMITESIALGERFVRANNDFSIGLVTNTAPFESGTYSDHQSFAEEGFPAILIIENGPPWRSNTYYRENPYYHTSDDTFFHLNMEQVKKITQLSLATVAAYNGVATGNEQEYADVAEHVQLNQNYPNPFNPSTVIQYQLQNPGYISLNVFDMLGNRIAVLVDGVKAAGVHQVIFDAKNIGRELSSGVYMYQLQTEKSVITKKMLLIK